MTSWINDTNVRFAQPHISRQVFLLLPLVEIAIYLATTHVNFFPRSTCSCTDVTNKSILRSALLRIINNHLFLIQECGSGLNFRIPGHNYVTLISCSRSPAVNKYLHMETKEKHMNIPRSIIHETKTSNCGSAGLREH